MQQTLAWMTLSQLPGLGVNGFWSLVNYFGTPLEALTHYRKKCAIPGIKRDYSESFGKKEEVREKCTVELERLHKMGGKCLVFEENEYPGLLKETTNPPPVLYIIGNSSLLNSDAIAVVGSRSASGYGHHVSFQLSKQLAQAGVTVISGLAMGIDAQAHEGALSCGGNTVGVLGCGIDVVYPRQNKRLFSDIAEKGVLVSEYPLGTSPDGFRFPARNRIIAGMSHGVLVVEAAKKSGSLITAGLALDEGREVYSVPGQIDSFKSEGTHWLIQQGAKLVHSAEDILEDFSWKGGVFSGRGNNARSEEAPSISGAPGKLLEIIDSYAQHRDVLFRKSGLDIAQFSEALLLLELEGMIEILPGNEICLKRTG